MIPESRRNVNLIITYTPDNTLFTILTPNAFSYGEVGINYQHRNIFDTETSVLRGCLDYVSDILTQRKQGWFFCSL